MSPGMKYRHYAPNTKCLLVYSDSNDKLIDRINQEIALEKNVLVLGKTSNLEKYNTDNKLDMGETLEEISKNIFTLLRKVDSYNVDLVIIEGVKKEGLGLAIMNRLIRACEHNYIEI
jgi:L-threonylcarbamoyladenylate synthase